GLGSEGVVGAVAAGGTGAVAGATPGAEALGAAAGVQDVRECLCAPPLSNRADGAAVGVPLAVLEPAPADLLPVGRAAAVLTGRCPEVGVRMRRSVVAPSAIPQEGKRSCRRPQRDAKRLLRRSGTEEVRLRSDGRRLSYGPGNLACLRARKEW